MASVTLVNTYARAYIVTTLAQGTHTRSHPLHAGAHTQYTLRVHAYSTDLCAHVTKLGPPPNRPHMRREGGVEMGGTWEMRQLGRKRRLRGHGEAG